MQYFVNISWIIHTCVYHSHPLKFQSTAKLSFGISLEWPARYFFWLSNCWFKHECVHWLKLDLESNVQSICFMIWYIIIIDGMHYRRDCELAALLLFLECKSSSASIWNSIFSPYFRRIYPPDDKTLLEKYESLLATAFQTFLAGRAASLQREMNNPLKRMKVLKHKNYWL